MNKIVTAAGLVVITVSMLAAEAEAIGNNIAHAEPYTQTTAIHQTVDVSQTSMADSKNFKVITVAAASTSGTFKDVPANHWAKSAIDSAVAKGYFKGYSDGTFKPNAQVTREEFAALISRVSNNSVGSATASFSDIKGRWSEAEVAKAVAQGFISPNQYYGNLKPQTALTRLEMAQWLVNGLGTKEYDYLAAKQETMNGLVPVAEFYKGGLAKEHYGTVSVALGTGLITGFQDGSFGGSKTTTRAEVAVILLRYASMQDKVPNDFPYLNEMREIANTGSNLTGKGYTYALNPKEMGGYYDFAQIRGKVFDVKGVGAVTVKRMLAIDYTGAKDNPYTKMFIGNNISNPESYTSKYGLVVIEYDIVPLKDSGGDAFSKAMLISTDVPALRIRTGADTMFGVPTIPTMYPDVEAYGKLLKANVKKTIWTGSLFKLTRAVQNDVSGTIRFTAGENSLVAFPPVK